MSDPIERQDAIDALADYIHNVDKVMGTGHLNADDCKDAATSVFEELPSAQPERKKGKWIDHGIMTFTMPHRLTECSECHSTIIGGGNFCSECGADMRGEKDE